MPRPPAAPVRAVLLAALLGLLSACSMDQDSFNDNRPDPAPVHQQVVRTPTVPSTEEPTTDPPLVQDLPGPTGGAPGSPRVSAPPASPGEEGVGGTQPAN